VTNPFSGCNRFDLVTFTFDLLTENVKLTWYQFWCTRCAFRLIKSLQWCSVRKSWKSKKCEICKRAEKKPKQCAMKFSQIRRRIELCMRENILRFEMNSKNVILFWQYNSYSYFKASTKVLSYRAAETLGDLLSTSRGLYPGVKMSN
jgi:hypothetical protein